MSASPPAGFDDEGRDDDTQAVTVETLEEVLAAFNHRVLDALMTFCAEDAVLDLPRGPDPWGTRFVGKAAVRAGLARRFAGIPDVRYSEDRHWVCGDRGVSEWLLTGTTAAVSASRCAGTTPRSSATA